MWNSTALRWALERIGGGRSAFETEALATLKEHLLCEEESETDEEECLGSPDDGSQAEPNPLDGIRAAYNALPPAEKEAVLAKLREMYPDHPAWKKEA